jgi:transposase
MPWRETDVVEERTRFVLEYESEDYTMAELCRFYSIARKTGYEWVSRYQAAGLPGLQDRRYGCGNHPNQIEERISQQILQLKYKHPSWGAKKLRGYLWRKDKTVVWPAVSTFGEILRRDPATPGAELPATQASTCPSVHAAVSAGGRGQPAVVC